MSSAWRETGSTLGVARGAVRGVDGIAERTDTGIGGGQDCTCLTRSALVSSRNTRQTGRCTGLTVPSIRPKIAWVAYTT